MSQFSIVVTDAAGAYRGEIGKIASQLRLGTTLPGGCGDCSFRIYEPIQVVPTYIGFNYDVRVLDAGRIFWSGRMDDFRAHRGSDGEYWTIIARGYGLNLDDEIYSSTTITNGATDQVIADAITNLSTSQIDATSISATSVNLGQAPEGAITLKLYKATTLINFAKSFGNSSDSPMIWYIYPDDDGTVRFTFKPRPTSPELYMYRADFDTVDFGLTGRQLANSVYVLYNGGNNSVEVEDTDLQGSPPTGWGIKRSAFLVVPEILKDTEAQQAGQTVLNYVKTARLSASNMIMNRTMRIYDSDGARINPWMVRAGQLVKIVDVDTDESSTTGLAFNNIFLIAATDWDEERQSLSITPESYDRSSELSIAWTRQLLAGRFKI